MRPPGDVPEGAGEGNGRIDLERSAAGWTNDVVPNMHLDRLCRCVTCRIGAGYRDGVDPTSTATSMLGAQPHVVIVNELPIRRSVAIARSVDGLIARDVSDRAVDCAGTSVSGRVADGHITHLVV